MNNPDEIEVRVYEKEEEVGKEILAVSDKIRILSDVRCLHKDTEVCDKCKLRFKCLTGAYLILDLNKDLNISANVEIPFNVLIQRFLNANVGTLDKNPGM